MGLSRKHYNKLADIIKAATLVDDSTREELSLVCKSCLIEQLVTMLEVDNPLFDKDRFVEACYEQETRQ